MDGPRKPSGNRGCAMALLGLVKALARGRGEPPPDWAPLFTQGRFSDWARLVPRVAAGRSLPFRVEQDWIEVGGHARRSCGALQDLDRHALARSCNEIEPSRWPGAIEAHFDRILAKAEQARMERRPTVQDRTCIPKLTPVLHAPVYSVVEMHDPSWTPGAELSWRLGVEELDRCSVPDAELLRSWNLSVREAFAAATRNLASQAPLERVDGIAGHPEAFMLRSAPGAEIRVLYLGEGIEEPSRFGYLVGIPRAGTALVLRITDSDLAQGIHALVVGMVQMRSVFPAALSGTLIWWRDGETKGALQWGQLEPGNEVACVPTDALCAEVFRPSGWGERIEYAGHERCVCTEFGDRTFVPTGTARAPKGTRAVVAPVVESPADESEPDE